MKRKVREFKDRKNVLIAAIDPDGPGDLYTLEEAGPLWLDLDVESVKIDSKGNIRLSVKFD